MTSGIITSFKPKVPFCLPDYSDVVKYQDKATVVAWGMPNYQGTISVSTTADSYTAPSNGYITFTAIGNNNEAVGYVDNVVVYRSNSAQNCSNTFPIGKGSVFTHTGGSAITSIAFTPCTGV